MISGTLGSLPTTTVADTKTKWFKGLIVRREELKAFDNGTSHSAFLLAIQVMDSDGIEKGMVLVRYFCSRVMRQTVFDRLYLAREGHTLTVPYTSRDGSIEIDPSTVIFDLQQLARDFHARQNGKDAALSVE